jgi:hypothetical protein
MRISSLNAPNDRLEMHDESIPALICHASAGYLHRLSRGRDVEGASIQAVDMTSRPLLRGMYR